MKGQLVLYETPHPLSSFQKCTTWTDELFAVKPICIIVQISALVIYAYKR